VQCTHDEEPHLALRALQGCCISYLTLNGGKV
jgi:hypothetical protein